MQVNGYDVIVGEKWQCKDGDTVVIQEIHPERTWCIISNSMSFNKDGYFSSTEEPGMQDLDFPVEVYPLGCPVEECDEEPTECDEEPTEYIQPIEPVACYEVRPTNGVSEKTRFIKYDVGKPAFDLVDPFFEEDIAKVLSKGAAKYAANNWQLNEDIDRFTGALQRHLNDIKKGIYKDKESKLQHTAHIACNAMFIHWMIRNGKVSK
jgi:hypothetical protein